MKNVFVDSNVLIYLIDTGDLKKRDRARRQVTTLSRDDRLTLSLQSIREVYGVAVRKRLTSDGQARELCRSLLPFVTAPENADTIRGAWRIQDETGFSWWDALLLASAQAGGCGVFLSEDLSHKRQVGDVLIHDPFLEPLES